MLSVTCCVILMLLLWILQAYGDGDNTSSFDMESTVWEP